MAEEINLGRLVAEIALENQDLENSAEEAIEAIKEIEDTAKQSNPKVNVIVNTTGADTAQNQIDSIPSDPISVGVSVNTTGAESAVTAINEIPKESIDIPVTVTGVDEAIDRINQLRNATEQLQQETNTGMNTTRHQNEVASANRNVADSGVNATRHQNEVAGANQNVADTGVNATRQQNEVASANRNVADSGVNATRQQNEVASANRNVADSGVNATRHQNEVAGANQNVADTGVNATRHQNELAGANQNVADTSVNATQAQNQLNESTRMISADNLDAAADAIDHIGDALGNLIPGGELVASSIQEITGIMREYNEMVESGASKWLVWGNVVFGIVSFVVNIFTTLSQQESQRQEEARQNAYQTAQEYEQEAQAISDTADQYQNLAEKLNDFNMTSKEEIELKSQLSDLQDEIIDKYGIEAENIDIVNGNIEENIKLLQEQAVEKARSYINENLADYSTAKEALSENYEIHISGGPTQDADYEEWLSKKFGEYLTENNLEGRSDNNGYYITTTFEDVPEVIDNFMKHIEDDAVESGMNLEQLEYDLKAASQAWKDIETEEMQQNRTIVKTFEENLNTVEQGGKNLVPDLDGYEQALNLIDSYNSSVSELSSAYETLSNGESLSADTLTELISKYPELAEYVKQTGDVTLDSGNKVKEVYKKQQQEITTTLNAEIIDLKLSGKATEEKEKQINSLTAVLNVYKNEMSDIDYASQTSEIERLNEVLEEYKAQCVDLQGEMSELADVANDLANGQALDADTVLSLVDKYPELAAELANAAGNADLQKIAIENLFEAKKADYLLTQQKAIDNIKASNQETEEVIENTKKQIQAYALLGDTMAALSSVATLTSLTAQLANNQAEIEQLENTMKIVQSMSMDDFNSSSGSGTSSEKTALEKELEQLEHKKALGQLTSKQEYDWLVKINNKYSMSADERMDMEEKIYNAKKQYEEELAQKQAENIQAEYDRIDKLAEQGEINTRQEIAQLEKIYKKYKLTTEQKIELEEKLAEKKKQLKDEEISALDTLGDAVVTALKNKYEQQKELEEKRIDESIENWQKWEDETCEAIQGQIDALDELKEAHDEENERQEYENKRQALELELAYEKDDYNRKQIEKEIAALDKEENERLFDLQIEQQKEALQEQMDSVKELSSEKQEALNEQKDSLSEKYDELTSDFALQAEAQKVIINSSQKQIIDLINSYAPEYEMAGTSLGEALYSGMTKKTSDITSYVETIEKAVDSATAKEKTQAASELESYMASSKGRAAEVNNMSVEKSSDVKSMQSSIDKLALSVDNLFNTLSSNAAEYKSQMAVTANAAADKYYATQQYYTTSNQSKVSGSTNVYMTVNFNDKVDSPIEVKRQLESVSEQLARQIASGY